MKVGILGTPVSSGNRGVMALGASLVSLCAQAGCREVALFVGHHKSCRVPFQVGKETRQVQVVNYRLSPRAFPKEHLAWVLTASLLYRAIPWYRLRCWLAGRTPWIAALEEMNWVGDIRGGDSFSDIYGWRRFLLGFLVAWTVVLVKGKLIHFPQTYGPYRRRWTRWLASYLLSRSPVIIARDRESRRLAQELAGPTKSVWLSPDVAFALEAETPHRIEMDPPLSSPALRSLKLGTRPIGLNVNGLMYNGGYTRDNMFGLMLDYATFLPRLVTALLQEHPGELWLTPHTYAPAHSVESDPEACRRVRAALAPELQSRVRVLTGEYNCRQIKGIIGQCDFFMGSRMHACIAALSQGIPCVGIAYSKKFGGVFESIGMRDWVVDARGLDEPAAIERILACYQQRDAVRTFLHGQASQAQSHLQEMFTRLVKAMDPFGGVGADALNAEANSVSLQWP